MTSFAELEVSLTADLTGVHEALVPGHHGTVVAKEDSWNSLRDSYVEVRFDGVDHPIEVLWSYLDIHAVSPFRSNNSYESVSKAVRLLGPRGGFRGLVLEWNGGGTKTISTKRFAEKVLAALREQDTPVFVRHV
jgi:hypothetical protein